MLKSVIWGVLVGVSFSMSAQAASSVSPLPSKSKQSVTKSARKAVVVPQEELYSDLSVAQLAVVDKVVLGKVPCELDAHVTVTANAHSSGRFILELGREKYFMEPVPTTTGAVRLEDPKSGAVWLQLANKSMLMNQKLGKRMADACMNSDQVRVAQAMEHSHAPGLLDPVVAMPTAESGKGGTLKPSLTATN